MLQQFNIQQLYVLPTLYLCVLYLSENKQRLVPLHHKMIGFYNRDDKCLLRGSLRFVFEGLIYKDCWAVRAICTAKWRHSVTGMSPSSSQEQTQSPASYLYWTFRSLYSATFVSRSHSINAHRGASTTYKKEVTADGWICRVRRKHFLYVTLKCCYAVGDTDITPVSSVCPSRYSYAWYGKRARCWAWCTVFCTLKAQYFR